MLVFAKHRSLEFMKERNKVKVTQLCPILCNPMDSVVHEILQGRILEWVAFSFFRGYSQPRDWNQVSHIAGRFFTSWATREAHKPLSCLVEFSGEGMSSVQFSHSVISDSATPWTTAHKASLSITNSWSIVFSPLHRKESWSRRS